MIDSRYGVDEKYFQKLEILNPKEDDPTLSKVGRLANKMSRNTERLIESRFDLKFTEWRILSLLLENNSLSLQAVIDYYLLVPNDVFVHAIKLQTRGYIEFQAEDIYAPARLTQKGSAIASTVQAFLIERRTTLLQGIHPDGLAMLSELIDGLQNIFDQEFQSISTDQLQLDELSEVVAGEDIF